MLAAKPVTITLLQQSYDEPIIEEIPPPEPRQMMTNDHHHKAELGKATEFRKKQMETDRLWRNLENQPPPTSAAIPKSQGSPQSQIPGANPKPYKTLPVYQTDPFTYFDTQPEDEDELTSTSIGKNMKDEKKENFKRLEEERFKKIEEQKLKKQLEEEKLSDEKLKEEELQLLEELNRAEKNLNEKNNYQSVLIKTTISTTKPPPKKT
jgi:hypothetical protein